MRDREIGELGKGKLPGRSRRTWRRTGNRAADADRAGQHGALFSNGAPDQRCRVFLDGDGEINCTAFVSPAILIFLYTRYKKVNTAAVTVTNLGEGVYYWMVQSYDTGGKRVGGEREEKCGTARCHWPCAVRETRHWWERQIDGGAMLAGAIRRPDLPRLLMCACWPWKLTFSPVHQLHGLGHCA